MTKQLIPISILMIYFWICQ